MKKLMTLVFLVFSVFVYSQNYRYYNIDFEDTSQFFRLKIDTISNPNNVWQIGEPQKSIFTSANSVPNAIVTDTVNSYPVNDTSIFIIKHVSSWLGGFQMPHTVILDGKYQINSDTINDFGILEFSPDNGNTWVNLLTDTTYQNQKCYKWQGAKPTLTGNSSGWTNFTVWVAGFGPVFNIQPGDTVQYRFTFVSDSIQTNKDGLIFDNLLFVDFSEGINETQNQFDTKMYPNPTSGIIEIQFLNEKNETFEFTLFDCNGRIILIKRTTNKSSLELDLSNYNSGIYIYKLLNQRNRTMSFGKILKQ
ncbi:MAG: T9SS type A sorting domain-containing protein [Bacteroidota bacterium]|nr:T9SS type A sorting domain-containing protein [Bacteroidota bacterium]